MLRFTQFGFDANERYNNFKTSYVTVYHMVAPKSSHIYFKTSNVTIYLSQKRIEDKTNLFQNILCYGLPCRSDCIPVKECQFQNILCYGLPVCRFLESARFRISKHPMLRFTFEPGKHTNWLFIISKHPMLRFTRLSLFKISAISHFKTSYVTVYLFAGVGGIDLGLFQNILCYGLPR